MLVAACFKEFHSTRNFEIFPVFHTSRNAGINPLPLQKQFQEQNKTEYDDYKMNNDFRICPQTSDL